MKKGILITSPKEIAIGGGISFSSLDRRDLRKALTYWDEIAYLTNNLVYQSDDELDKLKEFGAASELNTPLIGSIRGNQEFIKFIKLSEINTINSKNSNFEFIFNLIETELKKEAEILNSNQKLLQVLNNKKLL